MELILQMGHGMQSLACDLVRDWGGGTVILSPVNIRENRVVQYAKSLESVGGSVLFDPQLFFPKDPRDQLAEYSYWPKDGTTTLTGDSSTVMFEELLRINNRLQTKWCILPCPQMREQDFDYCMNLLSNGAEYFHRHHRDRLLATACIYPEVLRSDSSVERLYSGLSRLDVDGYYLILEPPNGEYIVSDYLWMAGALRLISSLRLEERVVVVGYANHQGLSYALAGANAIASGNFMNTRAFGPARFKPKDDDTKNRSVWYYCPSAMSEFKATALDVAMRRGFLGEFAPVESMANEYSAMLFRGAYPSSTNYRERNSFMHYLHCLRVQCHMLTDDDYSRLVNHYGFLLDTAERRIMELRDKGFRGQNRDFAQGIDVNRVALASNEQDYGLRLRLSWSSLPNL